MIRMTIKAGSERDAKILEDFWNYSDGNFSGYFLSPIWAVVEKHNSYFRHKYKIDVNSFKGCDSNEIYKKIHDLGVATWHCDECSKVIISTKPGTKRIHIKNALLPSHDCNFSDKAFMPTQEFEAWKKSEQIYLGGLKMLEFYQDEKGAGIRSNAKDEREFIDWAAELLSKIYGGKPYSKIEFEKMMGELLLQIVEICCKYRGYKANVSEQRILITGQILKGKPTWDLNEK